MLIDQGKFAQKNQTETKKIAFPPKPDICSYRVASLLKKLWQRKTIFKIRFFSIKKTNNKNLELFPNH